MIVPLRDIEIMFGQTQHDFTDICLIIYTTRIHYARINGCFCSQFFVVCEASLRRTHPERQCATPRTDCPNPIWWANQMNWININPHEYQPLNWIDIYWAN
jgi:hypothetical protein